jgi:hypothetical protein
MTKRTYGSPEAFKQALEQRLRTATKSGAEFARKRQLLVFDRFLARIVVVLGDTATLKGGLVLELRLERARTTKDIDLRLTGSPDDVLAKLQEAARSDLDDFLTFEVGPDAEHPEIQNDGMLYEAFVSVPTAAWRESPTGIPSASMWRSAIRSLESPRWSQPTMSSVSRELRPRRFASTRSRPTSPRSSTRTPCRAHDRTRA